MLLYHVGYEECVCIVDDISVKSGLVQGERGFEVYSCFVFLFII